MTTAFDSAYNERVFELIKNKFMYNQAFHRQLGPMVSLIQQFVADQLPWDDFQDQVHSHQRRLTLEPDLFIYYFACVAESVMMDERASAPKQQKYRQIFDCLQELIDYETVRRSIEAELPVDLINLANLGHELAAEPKVEEVPVVVVAEPTPELAETTLNLEATLATMTFKEPFTFKTYVQKSICDFLREEDHAGEFSVYDWLPFFINQAYGEGRLSKLPMVKDEQGREEEVDFENRGLVRLSNKKLKFYAGGDWQACSEVLMIWNRATQKFALKARLSPDGAPEQEVTEDQLFTWAFGAPLREVFPELEGPWYNQEEYAKKV